MFDAFWEAVREGEERFPQIQSEGSFSLSFLIVFLQRVSSLRRASMIFCKAAGEFFMLILTLFLIDLARCANFRVLIDSSKFLSDGEQATIRVVL